MYNFDCFFIIELQQKWLMSRKDMNMNSVLLQLTKQDLVNPVIRQSQWLLNLASVSKMNFMKSFLYIMTYKRSYSKYKTLY
jgi:hypothetical protein